MFKKTYLTYSEISIEIKFGQRHHEEDAANSKLGVFI